nr:MAG TPA: hypothetical protein [Caudoviricetes sp.]
MGLFSVDIIFLPFHEFAQKWVRIFILVSKNDSHFEKNEKCYRMRLDIFSQIQQIIFIYQSGMSKKQIRLAENF